MEQKLPVAGRITQWFDTPTSYIKGRTRHEAVDIVTTGYEPYFSMGDCTVMEVIDKYDEDTKVNYGNEVTLNYGDNIEIRACHLRKDIPVKEGQHLGYGEVIAYVGRTGYRVPESVYHTHIEVYKNGLRIEPLAMFNQLTYNSMATMEELKALVESRFAQAKQYTDEKVSGLLYKTDATNRIQKVKKWAKKLIKK